MVKMGLGEVSREAPQRIGLPCCPSERTEKISSFRVTTLWACFLLSLLTGLSSSAGILQVSDQMSYTETVNGFHGFSGLS